MARIVAENLEEFDLEPAGSPVFDSVRWCSRCQIPLLSLECPVCGSKAKRCARDLKPVFTGERALFESIVGRKLPTFLFVARNRVYFNGQTLFSFAVDTRQGPQVRVNKLDLLDNCDPNVFEERYSRRQWDLCLLANRTGLDNVVEEAVGFIQREAERFSDRQKVIAFSGGKDSAVTALLVKEALGDVPLLFGDTTIEFPDTYEYIEDFAKRYGLRLFQEKPDVDFLDFCDVLGPPSRLMKWCCTVCKSRPINKFYNACEMEILSFDGIRRLESNRRAKYPRVVHVQKYSRQVSARPILMWSSFAVWLYIFRNSVPYNPLYEYGYSRVGCIYCPGNSLYDESLTKEYFPELYQEWIEYLLDYASTTGKRDPEGYVLDGFWKARNIGKNRTFVVENTRPSGQDGESVYSFDIPIQDELLEFLKPLGTVRRIGSSDSSCFVVGSHNPFVITGTIGDTQLSVSFGAKRNHLRKLRIEKQIEKYLNCVHCGGCAGVCPHGAISIHAGKYKVDENVCTNCGRCTTTKYLREGCVALNYLPRKKAIRRDS